MYPSTARCPLASLHIPLGYNFEPVSASTAVGICSNAGMVIPTSRYSYRLRKLFVQDCVYDMIQHYPHAIAMVRIVASNLPAIHFLYNLHHGYFFRDGRFHRIYGSRNARVLCAGEFCSLNRNICIPVLHVNFSMHPFRGYTQVQMSWTSDS